MTKNTLPPGAAKLREILASYQTEGLSELSADTLIDHVQDIVQAELRGAGAGRAPTAIDNPPGLMDVMPTVGERDGFLAIVFRAEGPVEATVLQFGAMSEGKLEMHLMPVYSTIMRARAIAAQKETRHVAA